MSRLEALDVSANNGPIDWFAAKAAGVNLCSIRATTGTDITSAYRAAVTHHNGPVPGMYVDGQFGNSRANAKAAGITHRLFYHLLNGDHPLEQQADHFLATVGPLEPGEGVLLDYEVAPWTVDQAREWCEYVEARTGRPVGFYGRGERWAAWRDTRLFNGTRPRWLSCWVPEARARAAAAPYWGDAWQWTSKGTCPGVGGRVDVSQVDNPHGFDACCGLAPSTQGAHMPVMHITPGLPPVWGPFKVKPGARYFTAEHVAPAQAPYPDRLGICLHLVNYQNVGGSAESFYRHHLVPPGDKTTTTGSQYGTCYHAIVAGDGTVVVALDETAGPNSAGTVSNQRFVHVVMLIGDWSGKLDERHERTIEAVAQLCAEWCQGFGIPPVVHTVYAERDAKKRMAAALVLTNPNRAKVGIFEHRDISAAYTTLKAAGMTAQAAPWRNDHGDCANFPIDRMVARVNEIIQGDDMAQLVNTPGDAAAFEVSGSTARWVPDWASLVWLWDHGLVAKKVTTVPRADLKRLHLFGPEPFSAVSAIRGIEFATWNPAA